VASVSGSWFLSILFPGLYAVGGTRSLDRSLVLMLQPCLNHSPSWRMCRQYSDLSLWRCCRRLCDVHCASTGSVAQPAPRGPSRSFCRSTWHEVLSIVIHVHVDTQWNTSIISGFSHDLHNAVFDGFGHLSCFPWYGLVPCQTFAYVIFSILRTSVHARLEQVAQTFVLHRTKWVIAITESLVMTPEIFFRKRHVMLAMPSVTWPHTFWALNADSSKMSKGTNFKFGRRASTDSADRMPEKLFSKRGVVIVTWFRLINWFLVRRTGTWRTGLLMLVDPARIIP